MQVQEQVEEAPLARLRGVGSSGGTNPNVPGEIWTIGHSTRALEEFVGILQLHSIQLVADVRRYPGSRRFPHFQEASLREGLTAAQIEYIHFEELGGRRQPRPDSPNAVWRNDMFRGYADYMMTNSFLAAMERLIGIAAQRRSVLMCAEAVWWRCHRALLADHLKAMGVKVWHIVGRTKTELHPYTSAARVVEGKLTYSPEAIPLELPL